MFVGNKNNITFRLHLGPGKFEGKDKREIKEEKGEDLKMY